MGESEGARDGEEECDGDGVSELGEGESAWEGERN